MTSNNFIAIKLTFEKVALLVLLVFSIFITALYAKQEKEIKHLRAELIQQKTFIEDIESRVEEIENLNSDLEAKIDELEGSVSNLENDINYE
jgi:peptidoglycan hydrolase CwlO-like protein